MAQGIRFEDLVAATKRLKEEEAKKSATVERMSMEDFRRITEEEIAEPLKEVSENIKAQTSNAEKMFEEVKKQTESFAKFTKAQYENADAIASMAENLKTYSSPSEQMKERFSSFVTKISPSNIKETLMKAVNVKLPGAGGILDKQILKEQYVKKQMALGSEKPKEQIAKEFAEYNAAAKQVQKVQKDIEETKKKYGMSESVFKKSKIGKELLSKQVEATTRLENVDVSAKLVKQDEDEETPRVKSKRFTEKDVEERTYRTESPSTVAAEKVSKNAEMSEKETEAARVEDEQTELLKKIEENTRQEVENDKKKKQEKPAEKEKEGGIFSSILGALGGAAGGLGLGAAAKRFGGRALAAATPYAIPAAIMYGVSNAGDWAAGKLGVGKDEQGQDLVIDKSKDDANWQKMSGLQKVESGFARAIEKVGAFVGLDNLAREAESKRVKAETEYFEKKEQKSTTEPIPAVKPSTEKITGTPQTVSATGVSQELVVKTPTENAAATPTAVPATASTVPNVSSTVVPATTPTAVPNVSSTVVPATASTVPNLAPTAVPNVSSTVVPAVPSTISNVSSTVVPAVPSTISNVSSTISNIASTAVPNVSSTIPAVASSLAPTSSATPKGMKQDEYDNLTQIGANAKDIKVVSGTMMITNQDNSLQSVSLFKLGQNPKDRLRVVMDAFNGKNKETTSNIQVAFDKNPTSIPAPTVNDVMQGKALGGGRSSIMFGDKDQQRLQELIKKAGPDGSGLTDAEFTERGMLQSRRMAAERTTAIYGSSEIKASSVKPSTANAVYNQSAQNAEATTNNTSAANNNVVVAPTTINKKTEMLQHRPPVRNQDSTFNRYVESRMASVV